MVVFGNRIWLPKTTTHANRSKKLNCLKYYANKLWCIKSNGLIDSIDKKYVFPKVFLKLIFFQIDFSLEKNLPLKIILVTKNYHTLNYYHN